MSVGRLTPLPGGKWRLRFDRATPIEIADPSGRVVWNTTVSDLTIGPEDPPRPFQNSDLEGAAPADPNRSRPPA